MSFTQKAGETLTRLVLLFKFYQKTVLNVFVDTIYNYNLIRMSVNEPKVELMVYVEISAF